jgi:3-deoxy-D-manno-octulosonic-acid transferase
MTDVWLHGASAGDVRALQPLIEGLRAARPDLSQRLTCLTATGLQMAERLGLPCDRIRPPLGPGIARAMATHRPSLMIWEYLELWPAWVRAAQRVGARTLIVDGHVTARSQRIRPLLGRAAAAIDQICVRSANDAQQARALGFHGDRVDVCGNGKHDGMQTPPQPAPELRDAVGPVEIVVGSLHADEEAAALRALAQTGARVLIAPRYPRRVPHLLRRARTLNVTARRSRSPGVARWIILETMGELAAAYALGRVAIVGGTFGARGGQTLVEPAAHGRPIVHGPQVANISEEVAALAGRGAWQVGDWSAAVACAHDRLDDPGPNPRAALITLGGATARHLAHALRLLR